MFDKNETLELFGELLECGFEIHGIVYFDGDFPAWRGQQRSIHRKSNFAAERVGDLGDHRDEFFLLGGQNEDILKDGLRILDHKRSGEPTASESRRDYEIANGKFPS